MSSQLESSPKCLLKVPERNMDRERHRVVDLFLSLEGKDRFPFRGSYLSKVKVFS
jgi:hypothetical protein